MKTILMLLASLVLLVLVFLSGVIITANVIAEPEPHKFAHIDTPDLWTSKPASVDTAKQAYERLPATAPSESAAAAPSPAQTAATVANGPVDATVTASIDNQTNAVEGNEPATPAQSPLQAPMTDNSQPAVNSAQAQWCYARYRSYRIQDNSYQPFDGGQRRQCQAPGASTVQSTVTGEDVATLSQRRAQPQSEARPIPEEPIYEENPDYATQAAYSEPQTAGSNAATGSHEEWCFARYRSYRVEDNSYQPFEGGGRRVCQSPFG